MPAGAARRDGPGAATLRPPPSPRRRRLRRRLRLRWLRRLRLRLRTDSVVPPGSGASPAASLFGEIGSTTPAVAPAERPALLAALAAEVAACQRCPHLAATRTQTVFGTGSPTARLMFIGEAPGAEEDRTGEPFVGRAGQLLTDMITKGMGLTRDDVYIANILKSRPPENRDPLPDEIANCLPYLERQIAIIRPEFLCLLGRIAAQTLLETALPMGRLRGSGTATGASPRSSPITRPTCSATPPRRRTPGTTCRCSCRRWG